MLFITADDVRGQMKDVVRNFFLEDEESEKQLHASCVILKRKPGQRPIVVLIQPLRLSVFQL